LVGDWDNPIGTNEIVDLCEKRQIGKDFHIFKTFAMNCYVLAYALNLFISLVYVHVNVFMYVCCNVYVVIYVCYNECLYVLE
jgi:hypothetical protein